MAGRLRKEGATRRDREDAARLQRAGTHGDTVLAHINPAEARLLDALADGLLDGGGRNPRTGLLSFGMSDGESGRGGDSNPGGVGGGPAGGNTGGGIGGNTAGGMGGLGGGYDGSTVDGLGGFSSRGQLGYRAYDALKQPAIESLLAAPNFATPGMRFDQYAQPDTFARLYQEYMRPSLAAPGRLSAPNARGPGVMGSVVSQLAGGPFSAMMGIGAAMGRASSAATQAASAKEDAARSGHNSGGRNHWTDDPDHNPVNELAGLVGEAAGTRSGAETSERAAPPGYAVNPAGQIVPLPGGDRERGGLPRPVENLLYDYIWRGRQGSALGGWGW